MNKNIPLRIVIDTREQAPYSFASYPDVICEQGTLPTGDYQCAGFRCAAERKSLPDLIGSITTGRERFERELERARAYDFFCVVVEANFSDLVEGKFRSAMNAHSAAQSVAAFTARYVPFFFAGSRENAEYLVYSLFRQYLRSIVKRYEIFQKEQVPMTTLHKNEVCCNG